MPDTSHVLGGGVVLQSVASGEEWSTESVDCNVSVAWKLQIGDRNRSLEGGFIWIRAFDEKP